MVLKDSSQFTLYQSLTERIVYVLQVKFEKKIYSIICRHFEMLHPSFYNFENLYRYLTLYAFTLGYEPTPKYV